MVSLPLKGLYQTPIESQSTLLGSPMGLPSRVDVLAIQNATRNLSVTLGSGASKVGLARAHPVISHSVKGQPKGRQRTVVYSKRGG